MILPSAIFAAVTALSAIFAVVTFESNIFAVTTASDAICIASIPPETSSAVSTELAAIKSAVIVPDGI